MLLMLALLLLLLLRAKGRGGHLACRGTRSKQAKMATTPQNSAQTRRKSQTAKTSVRFACAARAWLGAESIGAQT